jgi:hypothetical protein
MGPTALTVAEKAAPLPASFSAVFHATNLRPKSTRWLSSQGKCIEERRLMAKPIKQNSRAG